MSPFSLDHIMVSLFLGLVLQQSAPQLPFQIVASPLSFPFPMLSMNTWSSRYAQYVRPLRYGILGQNRVELLTPSLSEKCSNRLSYWPVKKERRAGRVRRRVDPKAFLAERLSRRKEVIQPHFPVRLPCYDFTLLMKRTFDVAPHCWLN